MASEVAAARRRGDHATARKLLRQRRGLPMRGSCVTPATAGSGIPGTPMTISSGSPARRPKRRKSSSASTTVPARRAQAGTIGGQDADHPRPYRQKARFLGYDIIAQHSATRGRRSTACIGLRVPRKVITAKQAPYLVHGTPWYRPGLLNLDDLQIISTYGQEYRGLVQYYLLAGNVHELDRLHRTAQVLDAEDPGLQAPLDGDEDGPQVQGHHRHRARAACLLRGPQGAAGQEATGRTVRRYSRSNGSARRSSIDRAARPGHPPQGAGHPAPAEQMRTVPAQRPGAGAPRRQARRPRIPRPRPASRGQAHGSKAAQVPHGLPALPRPDHHAERPPAAIPATA